MMDLLDAPRMLVGREQQFQISWERSTSSVQRDVAISVLK
jgi:hypothetical protein